MRRPRTESEHTPHYSDDCLLIVDHEILVIQAPDYVDPRLAAVLEYLRGIESKCHGEQRRKFRLAKATWVHVLRISSHERPGD
jgi:hypothetical protein